MDQTEILTMVLPVDVVEKIRARVDSGSFASVSEVVAHDVREADMYHNLPDEPLGSLEDWENEVREVVARLDRGEEQTFTPQQVRERLAAGRNQQSIGHDVRDASR